MSYSVFFMIPDLFRFEVQNLCIDHPHCKNLICSQIHWFHHYQWLNIQTLIINLRVIQAENLENESFRYFVESLIRVDHILWSNNFGNHLQSMNVEIVIIVDKKENWTRQQTTTHKWFNILEIQYTSFNSVVVVGTSYIVSNNKIRE